MQKKLDKKYVFIFMSRGRGNFTPILLKTYVKNKFYFTRIFIYSNEMLFHSVRVNQKIILNTGYIYTMMCFICYE